MAPQRTRKDRDVMRYGKQTQTEGTRGRGKFSYRQMLPCRDLSFLSVSKSAAFRLSGKACWRLQSAIYQTSGQDALISIHPNGGGDEGC